MCGLLGVDAIDDHSFYLGLPSCIGRRKVEIFRYIRDKVWKRLQGWNQKLLSRAGKEILFKIVAQAMPNFAMIVYLLPLELCRDLEKMMNSFWWGTRGNGSGGINWMRCDRLCRPKAYGGLAFKQLHNFNFNIAMLGKQGWRLLSNPQTLVSKLFKARYFPKSSFVEASLGSNPSYAWRSIMAAQKVII